MDTYIRQRDLAAKLSISRTTIWRRVRDGLLPKPIALGGGIAVWSETEIKGWLDAQKTRAVDGATDHAS